MSKMDEKILVVDRARLFENESLTFQGVMTDRKSVEHMMHSFNNYKVVRRGDAEVNEAWKQPIPYAIIRRGEEVFLYKRLKAGNEVRLHDQLSIGVGGHMNLINDEAHSWAGTLIHNMYKELNEELNIELSGSPELEIIGIVNDEENEVGKVHICILAIIDIPEYSEVTVRETDKLDGCWIRIKDLKKNPLFENLESWSQMAVDIL